MNSNENETIEKEAPVCEEASKEEASKEETETVETEDKETSAEEPQEEKKVLTEEEESISAQYMRLMADFQNYKRRIEKEKADLFAYANEKIVTDMLAVIDNFERALLQGCTDEKFANGMDMIFKQNMQVLANAGLEEIKADGEDFNPNFHNAIMAEAREGVESDKVIETLQKGYTLKGKVIRPSMVKVSQ